MAAVPASHLDLECGGGVSDSSSVCFSDAEEGSCCSQFYSTADGDGSHDEEGEGEEIMESRRASSVAESDCSVAVLGNRVILNKSCVVKVETDCRICHLSLDSSGPESGVAIELGCSCKNDLAASHKHCAEEWFRIKGNRVCEICNSIAQNVIIVDDLRPGHQNNDTSSEDTNTAPEPVSRTRRRCPDGRFLNFVLALMVFAFVLSWLFHFNVHA